jgi:hypothetical protein
LIVSDWQEQAYNAVLAVYISCPILFLSLPYGSNNSNITLARRIEQEREEDKEGTADLRFDAAIRIAYNLPNQIVRRYLDSVDRERVPAILDVEKNPRVWSIRYRMMYEEMRVVKTCDEPLTFKWSEI